MRNLNKIKQKWERELKNLKFELQTSPEGTLNKKKDYYYQKINRVERSITKDITLIKSLARKRYIKGRIKQLEHNLASPINKMDLSLPSEFIATFSNTYRDLPPHYFFHPKTEAWAKAPYKRNNAYPEQLIYEHNSIYYRSMSERTIARELTDKHIPFRYDPIIMLDHHPISPDFIIKNPYTNETVIWEFFGAFHKDDYLEGTNTKMRRYLKSGYDLYTNLFKTFDYHVQSPELIRHITKEMLQ